MTFHLCQVTGTLVAPDGAPLPEVQVQFLPAPAITRAAGAQTRAPHPVSVLTDPEARIDVALSPGVYSVRTRAPQGREYPAFLVDVPAGPTAVLSDILLHLPAPQSVYDAAASARTAGNAAADSAAGAQAAEQAADRAEASNRTFASRSAFEAAQIPPDVPGWTVLHAGLRLAYRQDPAGTAIQSANGVRGAPVGEVRPEHWGAAPGMECAAQIQAAIDWLEAGDGGTLLFASRRYLIGATIRVRGNVWLRGEGWRFEGDYTNAAMIAGTWLELAPGSNCDMVLFRAEPAPGASVRQRPHSGMRDIGVFGRKSDGFARTASDLNQTGRGIRLEGVSYVTLDNVCAFRCAEVGVSAGSFDYGGQVGSLSCNNLSWRNVVAIANASHGFDVFGGDSTYSQLIAGFNGGIGIRSGSGPLVGCRSWNNEQHGYAVSRPMELIACSAYDNNRVGVRISGERIRIVGCEIYSNGRDESRPTAERAGVLMAEGAQDIVLTGNTIDNKPDKDPTQARGIFCELPGVRVELGTNTIRGATLTDVFFADWSTVSLHPASVPVNVIHPGFQAAGRIDMAGNRLHRAELVTLDSWRFTGSVSNGVLNVANNSLTTVNASGGATITGLSGSSLGLMVAIVRNQGAGALTFVHDPARLCLRGGANVVLAQNEAVMFVRLGGDVWQQVG